MCMYIYIYMYIRIQIFQGTMDEAITVDRFGMGLSGSINLLKNVSFFTKSS